MCRILKCDDYTLNKIDKRYHPQHVADRPQPAKPAALKAGFPDATRTTASDQPFAFVSLSFNAA